DALLHLVATLGQRSSLHGQQADLEWRVLRNRRRRYAECRRSGSCRGACQEGAPGQSTSHSRILPLFPLDAASDRLHSHRAVRGADRWLKAAIRGQTPANSVVTAFIIYGGLDNWPRADVVTHSEIHYTSMCYNGTTCPKLRYWALTAARMESLVDSA